MTNSTTKKKYQDFKNISICVMSAKKKSKNIETSAQKLNVLRLNGVCVHTSRLGRVNRKIYHGIFINYSVVDENGERSTESTKSNRST